MTDLLPLLELVDLAVPVLAALTDQVTTVVDAVAAAGGMDFNVPGAGGGPSPFLPGGLPPLLPAGPPTDAPPPDQPPPEEPPPEDPPPEECEE